MGALHRAQGVGAVGVERRALVEGECDVRAERGLDLHRRLRTHEALRAVEVGREAHPVLGDLVDHAATPVAAALDLVGDAAVAHREDLEAARVGDDRTVPAHELMQAAELTHVLVSGRDEEVEGVAEHHVVAERRDLAGQQATDRRVRRERHERRRAHVAVRAMQDARAGGAVAGVDLEGGLHRVQPMSLVVSRAPHWLRLCLLLSRTPRGCGYVTSSRSPCPRVPRAGRRASHCRWPRPP